MPHSRTFQPNRRTTAIRCFCALAIAWLNAAPAAANEPVAGQKIRAEIADRVFNYSGSEKGVIVYRGDGQVRIRTAQGYADVGTWTVKGERMCTRIAAYRNGRENCFRIFRLKKNRYKTDHGFWLSHVRKYTGG